MSFRIPAWWSSVLRAANDRLRAGDGRRLVLVAQQIAGLAVEYPADRVKGGEAHCFRASVFEYRDVCRGDADRVGEVTDAHPAFDQYAIDRDADRH
jgi:hypothetical protein